MFKNKPVGFNSSQILFILLSMVRLFFLFMFWIVRAGVQQAGNIVVDLFAAAFGIPRSVAAIQTASKTGDATGSYAPKPIKDM
jgi:hypothetical protein